MQISTKDWKNYIDRLSKLNKMAANKMQEYVQKNGFSDTNALIDYAYALVTKYGEGSAELACQMYDAIAEMSGVFVPSAVPAKTATYQETARAVQGSLLQSETGQKLSQVADRLVKQAGADTMLKNAKRDGAEWAWVPMGDTCSFCITLASRGWQRASNKTLKGDHAQHIHANCDCQFAIRFDGKSSVEGYDPDKYLRIYDSMSGISSKDKINSLRRMLNGKSPLTLDQLDFIIELEKDSKILGQKSPEEWKNFLDNLGFETKPLGIGSLKGIRFEDGGGFRINYRGDGYFQYHPPGTHHGNAYYKRSSAKDGIKRFNLDGSDKND